MNEKIQARLADARALFASAEDAAADALHAVSETGQFVRDGLAHLAELQSLLEQQPAPEPLPPESPGRPPAEPAPEPEPPGVEPPPLPPTRPPRPPGEQGWPAQLRTPFGDLPEFTRVVQGAWSVEGDYRHRRLACLGGPLTAYLWEEQWRGVNGTRFTKAIVNGRPGRGVQLASDDGAPVVLPPKLGAWMRAYRGPDGEDAASMQHIPEPEGVPAWLRNLCRRGEAAAYASTKSYGVTRIADANEHFAAVSGRGIGPFAHEWPSMCAEGRAWLSEEWLWWANRADICMVDEQGEPWNPRTAYAPYRNPENTTPGYKDRTIPPGAPPWAHEFLNSGKCSAPDISHFGRMIRAARGVAEWDAPARFFLRLCWNDIRSWLDGAEGPFRLTDPYWKILAEAKTGAGDSRGGRGFAHALRCFLAAQKWLKRSEATTTRGELWHDVLLAIVRKWAMPNSGITHAASAGGWPQGEQATIAQFKLADPICRTFEQALVAVEAGALGATRTEQAWRKFAAPRNDGTRIGSFVEARDVPRWHHSSIGGATYHALSEPQDIPSTIIRACASDAPIFENPLDLVPVREWWPHRNIVP